MSSLLKTPKLKALKAKWDAKLKKSGFEDIENGHPEEPMLKQWASSDFKRARTRSTFHSKQEYFYRAEHFLLEHKFESKQDRKIWEMHAAGATLQEIADKLKMKKPTVFKRVKKLRHWMLHGHHN